MNKRLTQYIYFFLDHLTCEFQEYGLGSEVSTQGDVYSFGILLLEMFTGKRPTDEIFQEGSDLHKLAEKSLSDGVAEIIDPMLLEEIGEVDTNTSSAFRTTSNNAKECLISIVEIGVACSVDLPGQRMSMSDVSSRLCSTRNKLLRSRRGYMPSSKTATYTVNK